MILKGNFATIIYILVKDANFKRLIKTITFTRVGEIIFKFLRFWYINLTVTLLCSIKV